MAMDYFELAQASSIRMCWEFEKRFPDFRGKQLELMRYLCLVVYNNEIYDGVCQDAWLRTTIKLKSHRPHIFSHSESTILLDRRMQNIFEISSQLSSSIEIRSNILPRRAYWDRQQELQYSSFWTRLLLQLPMPDFWRIISCGLNRRGFFPLTVLVQALEEGAPLTQKVAEWRQTGGISCDLATHFRRSDRDVPHARLRATLRKIKRDDVEFSMEKDILGTGSAGIVYKVAWKHCTYAMKSFKHSDLSQKELDIASKVLHAHIVHGFGYCEVDGQSCLLMEVLSNTLSDYAMEKARGREIGLCFLRGVTAEPLFSPVDTFDVLLQIARALEHCHDNNVVHGDLKPENTLLDHFEMFGNGRYFLAKVTDFGDAQYISPSFCPAGGGTTEYAAPELLRWRMPSHEVKFADPKKIDVYGFGAIAHEVLTGYPVYHDYWLEDFNAEFMKGVIKGELKPCGSDIWRNSRLKERFPADLIDLVEQCWEVRPENRPSFEEIRKRLVQLRKCTEQIRRNSVADLRKFIAAVFLMAFICCTSLVEERRFADSIEFIALILFAFSSLSLLMKFCVGRLISGVRSVRLGKVKTA